MSNIQITFNFDSGEEAAAFLATVGHTAAAPETKQAAKTAPVAADNDGEEDLTEMSRDELKELADSLGLVYGAKTRTSTLIDAITEARSAAGDEEEESEEEEEESEEEEEESDDEEEESDDEEEESDDEESEEEDEDSEEDDADYWTKDELDEKSIGELKAIARDYDIDPKGLGKNALIKKILAD